MFPVYDEFESSCHIESIRHCSSYRNQKLGNVPNVGHRTTLSDECMTRPDNN
jgi:hypothetical protein